MLVCLLASSTSGWQRVRGTPSCSVGEVAGWRRGVASDRRTDCRRGRPHAQDHYYTRRRPQATTGQTVTLTLLYPSKTLFQQIHDQQFFVFINLVKAFKTCYVRPFLTFSSYTNFFGQLWKILIILIRAFCICFSVSAYR